MHLLQPAFSARSTLSSGTWAVIGATKSAGAQFRRALTASSLFLTQPHQQVRTSSRSSSVPLCKELDWATSKCSCTLIITDLEATCHPRTQVCHDRSSPSTSKSVRLRTLPLSSVASRGSTRAASAKWRSNNAQKRTKWWSEIKELYEVK